MPVLTPEPPRIEQPEIDELVEELRALIEEARRRARRRRLFIAAFVLAALAAGAAAIFRGGGDGARFGRSEADASRSADVPSAPIGTWARSNGPGGAFVTAVGTTPGAIYVGTIQSGIFKSTDRGRTWRPVDKGLPGVLRVDALETDPSRPATVYAGSGEGVFKSTNGGRTWHRASRGLFAVYPDRRGHRIVEGYVYDLTVDPRRPQTIYASTFGGTTRSDDAGRTWRRVAPLSHASQIVFAPSNPSVAVALQSFLFVTRLLNSVDGGRTWTQLRVRFPRFGIGTVAIDARRADTFYAVGSAGLLKSTDAGRSWRHVQGPKGDALAFALDPAVSGTAYVSTREGLFKSTDGGANWNQLAAALWPEETVWLLAADRHHRGAVFGSSGGRLLRSADGGRTWTGSTRGLGATHVTSLAVGTNGIYAGTFLSAMFRSANAGGSWQQLETPAFVTSVVVDPARAHTVYAGTNASGVWRSDDDGETWHAVNTNLRRRRIFAVAVDRSDFLYAATGAGTFVSTNQGDYWHVTQMNSWAETLAVVDDTLYAGAEDGGVWRGGPGGVWELRARDPNSPVLAIAADPTNPDVVYAGSPQGVVKSSDGARSWRRALRGAHVLALAVDPVAPQTIYAGTLNPGVFRSTDGGQTWKPFARGLPAGGVASLAFSADGRRLYAGTVGYGVAVVTLRR